MSKLDFLEELRWRGMLKQHTPDIEKYLSEGKAVGYWGADPTSDSLTIGNLAAGMMMVHFQRCGHQPIILLGGATGMVGDPSGKSAERNLLTEEQLAHNIAGIRRNLENIFNFDAAENPAILVNNYDWFKEMNVLDFLRDVGKHYPINVMMAKDSVKSRLESGISFTEFSYQLIQGYDFKYLHDTYNCKLQVGGSDQWGNMTSGTELLRRCGSSDTHVITCPLVTKADGTKFGKSAGGAVWLDPKKTSPYKYYQFWLNAADTEVGKYLRIFTLLDREEIEALEAQHAEDPGRNLMQKKLAEEATVFLHGREAYEMAQQASQILFGKGTKDTLLALSEADFLDVFGGVPNSNISADTLGDAVPIVDFLTEHTQVYSSKGEARRAIKGGGVRVNKEKVEGEDTSVSAADLLNEKYLLLQKGKKNYHLVIVD